MAERQFGHGSLQRKVADYPFVFGLSGNRFEFIGNRLPRSAVVAAQRKRDIARTYGGIRRHSGKLDLEFRLAGFQFELVHIEIAVRSDPKGVRTGNSIGVGRLRSYGILALFPV